MSQPIGAARQANRVVLTATLIFSLVAMTLLVRFAVGTPDRWNAVAALVYGATLVACSLCSFLYNMLERAPRRATLRTLDHAAIFLLIAGTYTPFATEAIQGPFGFSLLGWVWALSLLGIALKLVLRGAYDRAFVGLYVGIGWFVVAAMQQVIEVTARPALLLLAAGGVIYTAGALVYARDKGRWTAPAWHGCVLAGAVTHFLAVLAVLLAAPGA